MIDNFDDFDIGPQSDEYIYEYGLDGYEDMWEIYQELLVETRGYDI